MGWIKHHGIVVTSWREDGIFAAHAKAKEIFPVVSDILPSETEYRSFFVPPDGSKEGWQESDVGDERRRVFIEWLRTQVYSDGSTWLQWLEYEHDIDGRSASIAQASMRK